MKKSLIPLIFFAFSATFSFAQPGLPDPTFGGGGGFDVRPPFLPDGHAVASAVAVQPNGRIVVAGDAWIPTQDGSGQISIVRYMPNGSLDPTFGGGDGIALLGHANFSLYVSDVVIQPDGKILCVGGAEAMDQKEYILLARFNTDGTPDLSFDGDGLVTTHIGGFSESSSALSLQADGKILVAGNGNLSGYNEVMVLRYKANGTLDNTFGGGDGIVTTPVGESYAAASDLVVQPDGKIVIGGYAITNGFEDFLAMRYTANGTLDNSFSGDGKIMVSFTAQNDRSSSIALQPDGRIVLAGTAGDIGAPADVEMAVLRLKADGTPDNTFSGDGLATMHVSNWGDYARDVLVQPDGKILVGGAGRVSTNLYHFTLVRLSNTGAPDNTFSDDGIVILPIGAQSEIYGMALQPDDKVVAVGWELQGDRKRFAVARFLTGLTVDTSSPEVFSRKIALFPNPVVGQTTLEYELATNKRVTVNLYDMQERFIQNILPPIEKTAGKHSETLLFANDIPSGNYLLVIESASGITTIKVIF